MQPKNPDCLWFKNMLANEPLMAKLKNIKLVVFDIDGTLTDAGIYVDDEGEGGRVFSVQDGYAFRPAIAAEITIALMSGKNNTSTIHRGAMLGIPKELCIVDMKTKPEAIRKLQAEHNFTAKQTMIVGDDQLDAVVKLEKCVALFACPNDAPFYYQAYADIILPRGGGKQAARLLLDLMLYINNKHFAQELIAQALAQ